MTDLTERVTSAIFSAIDALNEQLPEELRLRKTPETVLLNKTGSLDSVSFINFVVLVEERCQDEFGVSISLTGDMDESENPFQSIGSLVAHVCHLIDKEASHNF